ncbi:uncharacterized protein LOC100366610 [Saccoglossus kowalevskii]|uniref:Uncharacterized protein LOC100366610 n=1 Tax=Saccoglossus kowalevskii TaxID=10224 RepID=A0ABM0GS24_SACKO|nr:PREDICTED: uncharacterized protein LOC100366610 [Saccoglossus kowalevskii]
MASECGDNKQVDITDVDSNVDMEASTNKIEGQHCRKMDFMEQLSCSLEGSGTNVSMPFVVESKYPLTEDILRKSAILLSRRHPLLRSKVIKETKAGSSKIELFFGPMDEKDVVDIRTVDQIDWADTQAADGTILHNCETGPLWRIWFMKSIEISKEESEFGHQYRTNLVLGIHHGIMDGNSGVRLIDDLLTFLGMVHDNPDDLPSVESLPLIPGCYDLMPPRSITLPWYKIYKLIAMGLKGMTSSKQNMYAKYNKESLDSRSDCERQVHIHPLIFDRALTSKIVSQCRKNGVTVNSMFMVASAIAAAKFILGDNARPGKKYCMPALFAVNMRRFLPQHPGDNHISGFFSNTGCDFKVPVVVTPEEYWKITKAYHRNLLSRITNDSLLMAKIINFLVSVGVDPIKKMMGDLKKTPYGLMPSTYYMSNVGRCDFVTKENGRPFELSQVYMCVSMIDYSPLFVHNIFSIHGKILWGIIHCNRIMGVESVKQYADSIREIITMVCKDSE